MTEQVSKSKFAEICGLSRSAVTQACKGSLKHAVVGRRIDIAHPDAIAYKEKAVDPRSYIEKKEPKKEISASAISQCDGEDAAKPEVVEISAGSDVTDYLDMTLRDLVASFGTDEAFANFLRATKTIEDIHEKRLKNAEKAGELISREAVKNGLIDTINTAFIRMLSDGAKTIAVRAKASIETGATVQDVELMVADQLGSFIRPAKSKMSRVIRNV